MPVLAQDFLISAKALCESSSEIDQRNCISRAYYSMYHSANSVLTNPVPHYANGGVHSSLITHLQNPCNGEPHEPKKLRRLGYMLKQAKEHRSTADYDLGEPISDHIVATQIYTAEAFSDLCKELV